MSVLTLGRRLGGRRNAIAAAMIFGSGVAMSFLPVALALTDNPMLFIGVMGCFKVAALLAFMAAWRPALFRDRRVWALAARRSACWLMLIWFVGYYDLAAFAWAVRLIDPAVVVALYQLSPAIVVLWTERLFAGEGRYRRVGARGLAPFAFAAAGAACVIVSQAGGFGEVELRGIDGAMAMGVALGLLAAALDGTSGVGFCWGADLAARLSMESRGGKDVEMFCILIGVCGCSLLGGVSWSVFGYLSGERLGGAELLLACAAGIGVGALPTILWRWGNLLTIDLGVNVVRYFTSLLSLLWLLTFGLVGNVDMELLIAGAILILGANLGFYVSGRD